MSVKKFDLIIVGAGPAGLMAAMQAKRQGLAVAIFEKARVGGQALAANLIENFPGYPDAIRGPELVRRIVCQVEAHGVEITPGEVLSVFRENGCFAVKVKDGVYRALSVIIATGLSPKRLGLSGERELFGELVFSYENPEQLPCRNKQVLVIGSGDAAFDQALNFSRFASGVSIAMRSEKPRCAPLLLKRAKIAGVEIFAGCEVVSMKKVSGRLHIDFADGKTRETDLFDICIGKEKNFDFISSDLLVGGVPGIFFAGDCHRDHARHVVIACGDGTAAAMEAAEYLFKMVDNKGMR